MEITGHYPSFAAAGPNLYGVYCILCSHEAQDYVKCEHLLAYPDQLQKVKEQDE